MQSRFGQLTISNSSPKRQAGFQFRFLLAGLLVFTTLSYAVPGHDAAEDVDSGKFAVLINGKRVATETFTIRQNSSGSEINSEFKSEGNGDTSDQSSELQLTTNGELKKYSWKEISPGKAHFTVSPNNDFLMERYSTGPDEKEAEQPFLLPNSTSMLDDYSFVQREVLAWRYFASGCRQDKGQLACPLHQKTMFGTINPHARSSAPVSLEFAGREQVALHGVEKELIRLNLKSDAGDWALWLDDQLKLQRIVVPGENIEVIRD